MGAANVFLYECQTLDAGFVFSMLGVHFPYPYILSLFLYRKADSLLKMHNRLKVLIILRLYSAHNEIWN